MPNIRIFDSSIDDWRVANQEDLERLDCCRAAFGMLRTRLATLLDVTARVAQGNITTIEAQIILGELPKDFLRDEQKTR